MCLFLGTVALITTLPHLALRPRLSHERKRRAVVFTRSARFRQDQLPPWLHAKLIISHKVMLIPPHFNAKRSIAIASGSHSWIAFTWDGTIQHSQKSHASERCCVQGWLRCPGLLRLVASRQLRVARGIPDPVWALPGRHRLHSEPTSQSVRALVQADARQSRRRRRRRRQDGAVIQNS